MSMPTSLPQGYLPPEGPRNATHRPVLRRWLIGGALTLLFLIGGGVLTWAFGATLGAQAALWGTAAALVPLAVVVPAFLWLDRHEAEPPSSLVVAFGWGALVATSSALVINSVASAVAEGLGFDPALVGAVAVAPVVEEITKGLGILVVLAMRRREFDGVVDGIVYAGVIAAGFAFGENILYLGRALMEGGTEGLVVTFVLRGLMSPFAHPLFTMWTGVGIGVLVAGRTALRVLAPPAGLLLAMVLHAAWNAGSTVGFAGWVGSYLLVQVPVFVAAICFAVWIRRREDQQVGRYLGHYARAGILDPRDVQMLGSAQTRKAALTWARSVGGRQAVRAMRDFQDDAVELAYLRARLLRGHGGAEILAEERALVDSTLRARAAFAPR